MSTEPQFRVGDTVFWRWRYMPETGDALYGPSLVLDIQKDGDEIIWYKVRVLTGPAAGEEEWALDTLVRSIPGWSCGSPNTHLVGITI